MFQSGFIKPLKLSLRSSKLSDINRLDMKAYSEPSQASKLEVLGK